VHVDAVVAPVAAENVPTPHSEHEADPLASLKYPAWHIRHGPPSAPE